MILIMILVDSSRLYVELLGFEQCRILSRLEGVASASLASGFSKDS